MSFDIPGREVGDIPGHTTIHELSNFNGTIEDLISFFDKAKLRHGAGALVSIHGGSRWGDPYVEMNIINKELVAEHDSAADDRAAAARRLRRKQLQLNIARDQAELDLLTPKANE
jgi:hypothetical protein